jgi:protein TonB
MKPKKSKKANLENYRTIFLQVGMILTLTLILGAFEWKSSVNIEEIAPDRVNWNDNEEYIFIPRPEPEIQAVKPPLFEINIVDNNSEIDFEDLSSLISEIDEGDKVNIIDFVEPDEVVDDEPVLIAEFMPTFKGKESQLFRNYISEHIKFPEEAQINGIHGTVYASFVIDKAGNVTEVQILRGVNPAIDVAVLEAIKSSPKWEPGMNNGIFVKVRFNMPVSFKLL